MLVYIANLKKGEIKMEEILSVTPIELDDDEYKQKVELNMKSLLDNGEMAKIIAYKLFKQNFDINVILQTTGLNSDAINDAIKKIDPLFYAYIQKAKHDSENPTDAFKHLYDNNAGRTI